MMEEGGEAGPTFQFCRDIALEYGCYVAAGYPRKEGMYMYAYACYYLRLYYVLFYVLFLYISLINRIKFL